MSNAESTIPSSVLGSHVAMKRPDLTVSLWDNWNIPQCSGSVDTCAVGTQSSGGGGTRRLHKDHMGDSVSEQVCCSGLSTHVNTHVRVSLVQKCRHRCEHIHRAAHNVPT